MNQISLTTRLREYINKVLPNAHSHQQKAISIFVEAIVFVQSCCQASLARHFDNFEAASKRLSRLIHNEQIEDRELALSHARSFIGMFPDRQALRLLLDWTTEDEQHLLVASLQFGRRAIPLYWRGFEAKDLKEKMTKYEREFVRELFEQILPAVERRRFILTADRWFADVDFLILLNDLSVSYIIRTKSSHKVLVAGKWQRVGSLKFEKNQRRRSYGKVWYCETDPLQVHLSQARVKAKDGSWQVWHLLSNRNLSAKRMAYEYGCRFCCEEGFRDEKRLLGFADSRISCIKAWQRMFSLVAIALLMLSIIGSAFLRHEKKQEWLRRVRSRRKSRSELSLVRAVVELLKKEKELWTLLNIEAKLNLNARL